MSHKLLFIDTETTGLCNMREEYTPETLKNVWPHVTQVAWQVVEYSDDFSSHTTLSSENLYVYPEYSEDKYPIDIQNKTGITYSFLIAKGTKINVVMSLFFSTLCTVEAVVAHNATFDMKMLKAESLRLGLDNHMRIVPWIDTCYQALSLCNLKTSTGRPKFPTLTEFYQRVTGKSEFDNAHTADSDVAALIVCFDGLCKIPVTDKFHNCRPIMDATHFENILNKFKEKQQ